jgi:hypothetical protein
MNILRRTENLLLRARNEFDRWASTSLGLTFEGNWRNFGISIRLPDRGLTTSG